MSSHLQRETWQSWSMPSVLTLMIRFVVSISRILHPHYILLQCLFQAEHFQGHHHLTDSWRTSASLKGAAAVSSHHVILETLVFSINALKAVWLSRLSFFFFFFCWGSLPFKTKLGDKCRAWETSVGSGSRLQHCRNSQLLLLIHFATCAVLMHNAMLKSVSYCPHSLIISFFTHLS